MPLGSPAMPIWIVPDADLKKNGGTFAIFGMPAIPVTGELTPPDGSVTAAKIDSQSSANGTVLTSNGSGGAGWVALEYLNATSIAGVDKTGATNSLTGLQNAITAAIAAGHKRLYLPAGTYSLTATSGVLLSLASDGLQIFGDGEGKTIIKYADAQTLTADVTLLRLTGYKQRIYDLSIDGGTGHTVGAFKVNAISAYASVESLVENIEIYNISGGNTAGGEGIATYAPYNASEVSTTLTAAIASTGSQVATPASMRGIYVGRRLTVTAEQVVVTAVSATTFTAVFAGTHLNGATVIGFSQAFQHGIFRNITVRDSYTCSAFVVNSNGNTFENCRAIHIGSSVGQHGFYIQGGYNLFDKCHVEGVWGYSYHGWFQVPNIDASGNVLSKCYSLNPKTAHVIMGGTLLNVSNPEIPTTQYLNRYVLIEGCTFRNTNGSTSLLGLSLTVPCRVIGNVLEDVFLTGGGGWIDDYTNGLCVITNNEIRTTASALPAGVSYAYIKSLGGIIENNRVTVLSLTNTQSLYAIQAGGGTIVRGNKVVMSGGRAIAFIGANIIIDGNHVTTATNEALHPLSTWTGLQVTNNYLYTTATNLTNLTLTSCTGRFAGNNFAGGLFRYTGAHPDVCIEDNTGTVAFSGNASVVTPYGAGKLIALTADGTETVRNGARLVKYVGGKLLTVGTADTTFAGARLSTYAASDSVMYFILGEGREAFIECDEAWTQGNIAIPSTGTAGKVTDNGTAVPATSYGMFLDTGGAAGTARVLLVKTN